MFAAECELSDTCLLDEFGTSKDFDMHLLLGDWQLSALQLAANAEGFYHGYHIQYGHRTEYNIEYRIDGHIG